MGVSIPYVRACNKFYRSIVINDKARQRVTIRPHISFTFFNRNWITWLLIAGRDRDNCTFTGLLGRRISAFRARKMNARAGKSMSLTYPLLPLWGSGCIGTEGDLALLIPLKYKLAESNNVQSRSTLPLPHCLLKIEVFRINYRWEREAEVRCSPVWARQPKINTQ